ncbi:transposase (plasmid) [Enterobacter bugandensis]|nr:transposase [Enterobacter bugandensis]WMU75523.1 transposase [Enterobacter bugandensis]
MLVILRSHHFDTAEQVAAFLGVVPVERSSGTSVRNKPKLSKNGPPEIRAKLYLSSMCGLRFYPLLTVVKPPKPGVSRWRTIRRVVSPTRPEQPCRLTAMIMLI